MASLFPCSFCSKCGFCLENEFKFCPKCGVKVRTYPSGRCETTTTPFSLPNFHTFKSQKESERKTFFARKPHAGHKKRKVDDEMVTINVGVMKEKGVIKRGETLPLKVPSTASAEDIRLAAVKKHTLFMNSRFIHSQCEYFLAFKDGSEVKHIPGVGPEEPFTLRRYKEESGFGYARITLYLLPEGDIFEDLRRYVDEEDDLLCDGASKDSSDDEDFIKPALKPSLYPVPLKRQSFSSGRGKSTAAGPSTSSAGDDCFLVNCPTCWGTFPISAIEEHADRCAQSVEELPDPHPVNSSCSRSTGLWCLYDKLYCIFGTM